MKRIVVTQTANEMLSFKRSFVLEIPDETDVTALEPDRLGYFADNNGVHWHSSMSDRLTEPCAISDEDGIEAEIDGIPVLSLPPDGLPVPQDLTNLTDEEFYRLLGVDPISDATVSPLQPDETTSQLEGPRAKRVHVKEMDCVRDAEGGFRASNGGLYEVVGDPTKDRDPKAFRVIPARDITATVDDLRSLRNLLMDLEGFAFPIHHDHDRLAFWKWKATVIQRILEHPAMRPGADPSSVPCFDSLQWEKYFLGGMSVLEAVEQADEAFNRGGW